MGNVVVGRKKTGEQQETSPGSGTAATASKQQGEKAVKTFALRLSANTGVDLGRKIKKGAKNQQTKQNEIVELGIPGMTEKTTVREAFQMMAVSDEFLTSAIPQEWVPRAFEKNGGRLKLEVPVPQPVDVVDGPSCFQGEELCISAEMPLAKFANKYHRSMAKENQARLRAVVEEGGTLKFLNGSGPSETVACSIKFRSCLRYPSPAKVPQSHRNLPTFGDADIVKISTVKDKVPPGWLKDNGLVLGLSQLEACAIEIFSGQQPVAVRISVNGCNIISGKPFQQTLTPSPRDFFVCPPHALISLANLTEQGRKKATPKQMVAPRPGTSEEMTVDVYVTPMVRQDACFTTTEQFRPDFIGDWSIALCPKDLGMEVGDRIYLQAPWLPEKRPATLADYSIDSEAILDLVGGSSGGLIKLTVNSAIHNISVSIPQTSTVSELRQYLGETLDCGVDKIELLFKGKVLRDVAEEEEESSDDTDTSEEEAPKKVPKQVTLSEVGLCNGANVLMRCPIDLEEEKNLEDQVSLLSQPVLWDVVRTGRVRTHWVDTAVFAGLLGESWEEPATRVSEATYNSHSVPLPAGCGSSHPLISSVSSTASTRRPTTSSKRRTPLLHPQPDTSEEEPASARKAPKSRTPPISRQPRLVSPAVVSSTVEEESPKGWAEEVPQEQPADAQDYAEEVRSPPSPPAPRRATVISPVQSDSSSSGKPKRKADILSPEENSALTEVARLAAESNKGCLIRCLGLDEEENVLLSPISIYASLAVLVRGAGGKTQQGLCEALRLPPGIPPLRKLDLALSAAISVLSKTRMSVTTSLGLWKSGVELSPGFQETLGATDTAVIDGESTGTAVEALNKWISSTSGGRVHVLTDQLSDETPLAPVSSLCLDIRLDARTCESQFMLPDGSAITCSYVDMTSTLPHASPGTYQAVCVPHGTIDLLFFIPNDPSALDGVIREVLKKGEQDGYRFSNIGLSPKRVRFLVPSLMSGWGGSLKDGYSFGDATIPGSASFAPMLGRGAGPVTCHMGDVMHRSRVFLFAPRGARTPAVGDNSGINVRVESPFFLVVRERQTGCILLWGRVSDPSKDRLEAAPTDDDLYTFSRLHRSTASTDDDEEEFKPLTAPASVSPTNSLQRPQQEAEEADDLEEERHRLRRVQTESEGEDEDDLERGRGGKPTGNTIKFQEASEVEVESFRGDDETSSVASMGRAPPPHARATALDPSEEDEF